MSFVASSIVGTLVVGGLGVLAYEGAAGQRKSLHQQKDALAAAAAEEQRKSVEAETQALVAANAQLADTKRRRRASSLLAGGDPATDSLGGPDPVLSAGGPTPAARAAAGTAASSAYGSASVLGSGAAGRSYRPTTPTRAQSV